MIGMRMGQYKCIDVGNTELIQLFKDQFGIVGLAAVDQQCGVCLPDQDTVRLADAEDADGKISLMETLYKLGFV